MVTCGYHFGTDRGKNVQRHEPGFTLEADRDHYFLADQGSLWFGLFFLLFEIKTFFKSKFPHPSLLNSQQALMTLLDSVGCWCVYRTETDRGNFANDQYIF